MGTKFNLIPTRDEHNLAKNIRIESKRNFDEQNRSDVLKYRVTCERSFNHSFTSVEAQHMYGAILNDKYNWVVALDDFDLNIILYIAGGNITNIFQCFI